MQVLSSAHPRFVDVISRGRRWFAPSGLCLALLLGACSGAPPSVDEVVASAERKSSLNDDKGAAADLKSHIAKHGDASGRLTWHLARANARSGDVDGALAALEASLKSRFVAPELAMIDPAFVAMRTDIRFVTLIAGGATVQPVSGAGATTSHNAAAGAAPTATPSTTTASLDGGAVEARAGSVSVRLPD